MNGPEVDGESAPTLDAGAIEALTPLLTSPASTAILTDFDGTLAPIVTDPASVQALPGVEEDLTRLAAVFGEVAVISGRTVSFLADRLPEAEGVRLVGLYGLEWADGHGGLTVAPGAEAWRPVVAGVVERLRGSVPPGARVEDKGLTVTVHWRQAADRSAEIEAMVAAESEQTGLRTHPGRLSAELRPPLDVDKGTAVEQLTEGFRAAVYLGDDLGDLPAFAALHRLSATGEVATIRVAAVDYEAAPEVADAADVRVNGPRGAAAVLRWLADHAPVRGGSAGSL